MRLMLDTHVLLWWRDAARPLSRRARAEIADAGNEIVVSIVSLWEITIKRALGKITFPDDLEVVLQEERFTLLSISFQHLRALDALPHLHRDPFDRLLLAQSLAERLPILSIDRRFAAYGATLIW
jgi:PIN domain nuclease of toxin-antitoxin system